MTILKPALSHLKAYHSLEKNEPIRLNSNESENYLFEDGFQMNVPFERYPDNHATELKAAIAQNFGLQTNQLLVGSGSSEILEWVIKSTVEKGKTILTAGPTFVMYQFYATLHECRYHEVPLKPDFSFDEAAFLDALEKENPQLVILCSPNNPTGGLIPIKTIEKVIQSTSALVLIDEAYIEFAKDIPSFIHRVNDYDHVIVTRTFSKAYGLAAIRLGYAVSNPKVVEALTLSKTPYNVNRLSQLVGLKAIQRYDEVSRFVGNMIERRDRFKKGLEDLGFFVYPSYANFVWLKDDFGLFDQLRAKGILTRTFHFDQSYLRITIGLDHEMDQTLIALKEIIDDMA